MPARLREARHECAKTRLQADSHIGLGFFARASQLKPPRANRGLREHSDQRGDRATFSYARVDAPLAPAAPCRFSIW